MPPDRPSIDRLLRRTLAQDDVPDSSACLDADTFAAWFDGGLTGDALERVETHAASCARCRAILSAMARTEAAAPAAAPRRTGLRWLAWAAPLTAAAAAVVVWMVVPAERTPAVSPAPASVEAPAPAEAPAVAPAPPAAPEARQAPAVAQRQEAAADKLKADAVAGFAAAPVIVSSPDAAIRYRLTGTSIERSTDGGATWSTALGTAGHPLTAGSAPSTATCWVVGRGGTVLLATDGATFVRVPFPETTDLTAVAATDARSASVTTADGRVFATSDGGATWAGR